MISDFCQSRTVFSYIFRIFQSLNFSPEILNGHVKGHYHTFEPCKHRRYSDSFYTSSELSLGSCRVANSLIRSCCYICLVLGPASQMTHLHNDPGHPTRVHCCQIVENPAKGSKIAVEKCLRIKISCGILAEK
jgi:hypothetical protein